MDDDWSVGGEDGRANSVDKLQHGVSALGHSVVGPGSEVELSDLPALSTVLIPLAITTTITNNIPERGRERGRESSDLIFEGDFEGPYGVVGQCLLIL